MRITITFLSIFLFFLLAGTQNSSADILDQLEQVDVYKWYPAQAEAIYEQVTADYPAGEHALYAHKNLILSYICAKRYDDARQSVEALFADFADHSLLPVAIYDIASEYELRREYDSAKELYQQIAQQYPDSPKAKKVKLDLPKTDILSNIEKKEYQQAEEAISAFINDFNDNSYLPDALYTIARRYERAKQYQMAEQLYNQIINDYHQTQAAADCQLGLARIEIYSLVKAGDFDSAKGAVNSMISDYSSHPALPEALDDVAIRYGWAKDFESSRNIYQTIINRFPGSSHVTRASLDIAKTDVLGFIAAGDDPNASAVIEKMRTDFAGHSHLPYCLNEIAKRYGKFKVGKFEKASELFEIIVQDFPDSSYSYYCNLRAAKAQILHLIDTDQDELALQKVDEMLINFAEHPILYKVITFIEEMYFRKLAYAETPDGKNHVYSIKVWDKVLQRYPDFYRDEPFLYYHIACCYYQLGRYSEAIDYFNMVVAGWPDFMYAWGALELIKKCCEGLTESGEITEIQADGIIEQSYFRVIQIHPGSVLARNVAITRGPFHFNNANWADAAKYFEAYLLYEPQGEPSCTIMHRLMRCYEQMGESTLMSQLYDKLVENCLNSK